MMAVQLGYRFLDDCDAWASLQIVRKRHFDWLLTKAMGLGNVAEAHSGGILPVIFFLPWKFYQLYPI
jgi:hypothetical protein